MIRLENIEISITVQRPEDENTNFKMMQAEIFR
jgi:hypothetical protein